MEFRLIQLLLVALIVVSVSAPVWAQKKQSKPVPKPASTQPDAKPAPAPAAAPEPAWSDWAMLSPEGEEFSVSMPKDTSTETGKFPYHKMELNTRLYMSSIKGGPVVAIASFSGIKSDPAKYSDFTRFNSYVDAFKDFFPSKVRPDTVPKLTLVGSKPFNGNTGRQYKMTLGDLNGSVQAYITRKRFYAIVSLNTKRDDALEEKFLSSFKLPERTDQPVTAAAETNLEATATDNSVNSGGQQKPNSSGSGVAAPGGRAVQAGTGATQVSVAVEDNTEAGVVNAPTGQKPDQPQGQPTQKRGQINGGMLNSKALYMPTPEAPVGEPTGVVMVQVLIDEQGSVVEARALSGPPNLHAAAVNAARLARFQPTLLAGEPVKVSGTLSYNFVRSN
jgi:hypothetical protein